MNIERPDWPQYFFGIAKTVSARSTCPSRKVGAVIVDSDTKDIISTGYNGAPRGTEHCGEECANRESGKSYNKCKAIHGELNAIISAARAGKSVNGSEIYLTTTPCVFCSRTIIQSGIQHVYAMSTYPHPEALDLLAEGGVKVTIMTGVPTPNFAQISESEIVEER